MTAAETAKSYGLKSLTEAAELLNMTTQGLRNWHRDEPQRFEIVMMGCAEFKRLDDVTKKGYKLPN